MTSSYAERPPASQPQTLPSFREVRASSSNIAHLKSDRNPIQLLPAHLHDEIDSSSYYNSRQERPPSGHELPSDPRSMPPYPSHPPSTTPYDQARQYTARAGEQPPMSMRGPSPILPPIRDLQTMPERNGAYRSDPFAPEYRTAQPPPGPSGMPDRRHPDPYPPVMHAQPPYGPPHMAYQGDPGDGSAMMAHHQQANFGIMGEPVDPRTRRRRGNLPKPVTDILRAWFHEHLEHPYPSEDDKQIFMNRTGLSISQVGFICRVDFSDSS